MRDIICREQEPIGRDYNIIDSKKAIESFVQRQQTIMDKLKILTDAAKYDVSCSSSGVERKGNGKDMGNCSAAGICHSFSADGRCIFNLSIIVC